jgi:nucleoside-diphosphate-sugar epimerase
MIKVLITGSSGFIASNLYRAFHTDYELYGLDITKKSLFHSDKIFAWDEFEKLPKIEVIIHLAGKAHDTSNAADPHLYYEINLGLTKQIFDYFLDSEASTFIFFSTVKAVADTVEGKILTEESKADPKTPYGKSKLAAEQYIQSKLVPAGKKVFILRPCMVHGPGNKGNLNLLYQLVRKGIPWPLGAFHNFRSFTSVENLIYILRQLIEKDIQSGTYQLADDDPVSTNELIQMISLSSGKKAHILHFPKRFIRILARAGDLFRLSFNSERLQKLTESYMVSNQKIKSALGIQNLPIAAKDGLINTLKSFNHLLG